MVSIAIVEDSDSDASALIAGIEEIAKSNAKEVEFTRFSDAESFLKDYSPSFDIVFMDIELGKISGMEASKILRENDEKTILIFTTNMRQFAAEGYSVEALDYVIKPISLPRLQTTLTRAFAKLEKRGGGSLLIRLGNFTKRIPYQDILYVETLNHRVLIHTAKETIDFFGAMKKITADFPPSFALCNSGYLVNLDHVTSIVGEVVSVKGNQLHISRYKKKAFLSAYLCHEGEK